MIFFWFFILLGQYTYLGSGRYAMKLISKFINVLAKHNKLPEIYLVRIQ